MGSNDGSISGSSVAGRVSCVGQIGGLAGDNSGSVSGSNASATVSGGGGVGGLVGGNPGTIADSHATGTVTSEGSYVGGLVGSSRRDSAIAGSYATGRVTGNSDVGGLIGDRHFIFVADSYWDTQTTGQSRSDGGAGKTTRECGIRPAPRASMPSGMQTGGTLAPPASTRR